MAETSYTYSIASDFSSGLCSNRLASEVQSSAIVTALDRVDTDGDDCLVWFKAALSAGDETVLDGLVAAHTGEELCAYTNPTYNQSTGGMVVSQSYSQFEEDAQFKGHRVACPADTVTIYDIPITVETYVNRGKCWFINAHDGDEVEISLVDKNDIVGLFSTYGYTVGVDVLELGKWAETIPMFPGNVSWTDFSTEDNAPLLAGLFLRLKYDNSHATEDSVMGMVFHWFKGDS